MLLLIVIWVALLAALIVFAVGRPGQGGALTLAYFLGLSLIHIPGVLPFLVPGAYLPDFEETLKGLQLTILGMATFVAGAVAAKLLLKGRPLQVKGDPATFEALGLRVLIAGAVSYFVLLPATARFSSVTSLISPLGTLLIVGIWMRLYGATFRGNSMKVSQTLSLSTLMPLSTLGSAGYLGYGVYWLISVVAFQFTIERRRIVFYAAAPIVAFLGLSLFSAYMGERIAIRDAVWYQNAGISDRLDRIAQIFVHFHPLDLNDRRDVGALEERLNQNILVGLGVNRAEQGVVPFYYGGTVPVWVVVPRAIWPDKPAVAGGSELVTDFTGETFRGDTSVGLGQVLEFYMNFGIPGVVIGFALWGFLLSWQIGRAHV